MPRIKWEQNHLVRIPREHRKAILDQLRVIVAEEISRFDPSFQLDPFLHTVTDISVRDEDAQGDKQVIISVYGLAKPARIDQSQAIGSAIRERAKPMFTEAALTWVALSLLGRALLQRRVA